MFAPGDATVIETSVEGAASLKGGMGLLGLAGLVAVLVM
jgi:hypothetical protein